MHVNYERCALENRRAESLFDSSDGSTAGESDSSDDTLVGRDYVVAGRVCGEMVERTSSGRPKRAAAAGVKHYAEA